MRQLVIKKIRRSVFVVYCLVLFSSLSLALSVSHIIYNASIAYKAASTGILCILIVQHVF